MAGFQPWPLPRPRGSAGFSPTFLLLEVEVGTSRRRVSQTEAAFIQRLGALAGSQEIKDIFRQPF